MHQVHSGVLDVGQEEGVQGVQPGLPQVPQVACHQRRPRLHQHQLPSASSSQMGCAQAGTRVPVLARSARATSGAAPAIAPGALCLRSGNRTWQSKAVIHGNSVTDRQGGACTCFSAR